MHVSISPARVGLALWASTALLALACVGVKAGKLAMGFDPSQGQGLFFLDGEANLPAWFSASLFLVSALIVGVIARGQAARHQQDAWHWAAMAVLLLLLSADEVAMLHERLTEPLRRLLGTSGLLHFAWILPGAAAAALVAFGFARFLWRQPRRVRTLFLCSGALFVLGAIGMEMVGGQIASSAGTASWAYFASSVVEETLEMLGSASFVYALLAFLAGEAPGDA